MTATIHTPQLTTSVVAPALLDDVGPIPPLTTPASVRAWRLGALDLVAAFTTVLALQIATSPWALTVTAATPALWLVLVSACGGYRIVPGSVHQVRARSLARAGAGAGLALWVAAAVAPGLLSSTAETARAGLVLAAVMPLSSMALRRLLGRSATSRRPCRIVLAGDHRAVDDLLREMRHAATAGTTTFEPVAVCLSAGSDDLPHTLGDLQVWKGLDLVADAVNTHAPHAVVVVPGGELDHHALRRLGARLQETGTEMLVSAGLRDVAEGRLELVTVGGIRALQARPAPMSGLSRLLKDVVDRLGAAVLLVLLAPVLALLVGVIRLGSPGPALFRQVRVGHNGQLFSLWKLRTMRIDAEQALADLGEANEYDPDGLLFKIRLDPRLTRVGRLLRKYSLDELPQLVNVVRGQMSLVGPRPALPSEVRAYDDDLLRRLVVKPGMTGLWQVSGRSDLTWEDTVRLDLAYVDNWSWTLDGQIVVRTIGAVVGHRGAY